MVGAPVCGTGEAGSNPAYLTYIITYFMKHIIYAKPKTLTETEEHVIVKRKWWAVFLLITGGIMLAGRFDIPAYIPYIFFFFGHAGMFHSFWKKHDYPMVMVNGIWLIIDIVGCIRWFSPDGVTG